MLEFGIEICAIRLLSAHRGWRNGANLAGRDSRIGPELLGRDIEEIEHGTLRIGQRIEEGFHVAAGSNEVVSSLMGEQGEDLGCGGSYPLVALSPKEGFEWAESSRTSPLLRRQPDRDPTRPPARPPQ
jgi:hypothetical protein